MAYTFRSKLLIFIGKYAYGNPTDFGVDCTAEEFYALENERTKANPSLHPAVASNWHNMRNQLYKNEMRLTVFKHVSYVSVIFAVAVLSLGNISNAGFVFIGDKVSVIESNYKLEKQAKEQVQTLISDLTKQQQNDIESWNANHDKKDFAIRYFNYISSLDSKIQLANQLFDNKSISHGTFTDDVRSLYELTAEYTAIKKDNTLVYDQSQVDQINEMSKRINKTKQL